MTSFTSCASDEMEANRLGSRPLMMEFIFFRNISANLTLDAYSMFLFSFTWPMPIYQYILARSTSIKAYYTLNPFGTKTNILQFRLPIAAGCAIACVLTWMHRAWRKFSSFLNFNRKEYHLRLYSMVLPRV